MLKYVWREIYGKDLLKTFFKTGNISCFDMVMMYLCPIVMVLGFFLSIVLIVFHITGVELFDFFSYLYASGILSVNDLMQIAQARQFDAVFSTIVSQ